VVQANDDDDDNVSYPHRAKVVDWHNSDIIKQVRTHLVGE